MDGFITPSRLASRRKLLRLEGGAAATQDKGGRSRTGQSTSSASPGNEAWPGHAEEGPDNTKGGREEGTKFTSGEDARGTGAWAVGQLEEGASLNARPTKMASEAGLPGGSPSPLHTKSRPMPPRLGRGAPRRAWKRS